MAIKLYRRTALIGGASNALDGIDGVLLNEGDECRVYAGTTSEKLYPYRLNASSGEDEHSPNIIAPDNNSGSKRWILQTSQTYGRIIGPQLVKDYDNESAVMSSDGLGISNGTLIQSSDQAFLGTYSAKFTETGGVVTHYIKYTTTVAGVYQTSVWVYLPSSQTITKLKLIENGIYTLDETIATDAWVNLSAVNIFPGGGGWFGILAYPTTGDGNIFYVDNWGFNQIFK